MAKAFSITFVVPAPYNAGEWRISEKRGRRWKKLFGAPATGGTYETTLPEGEYKETYWSNGFPHSVEFSVNHDGSISRNTEY